MSVRSALLSLSFTAALFTVGCSSIADDPIGVPRDPGSVERGRRIVKGLAACGYCHGERPVPAAVLQGGRPSYDRYGAVRAANITPATSGIGDWTPRHVVTALRSAVNANGEPISREVHKGYEWMSDADLFAVVAYLKTLPPVAHTVKRRQLDFYDRNVTGFFDGTRSVRGHVPEIDRRFAAAYGQYLTDHVARCGSCHNTPAGVFSAEGYLSGGGEVSTAKGTKIAPGITGSEHDGIGGWSEAEIVRYLKSGRTPDGKLIDSDYCPVGFYALADDGDLGELARFIKSVR